MTRAAEVLGVSQPALSAMMKKLEAEVGAALLDRTGRGVELTEAGRVFLSHAEAALRSAEAGVKAVRELAGLERGSIRIGGGATAVSCLLPPVVSAARRAHPGLRFYVREAGSSAVALAVLSGELDLGIVTLPVGVPGSRALVMRPLVEDELRLIGLERVGPRQTSRRETGTFTWSELAGVPVVAFEAGTAVRELVDAAARRGGVSLDVVMELRSIESIKRMVSAGVGVGFVSRFALGPGEGLASREGGLSRRLAVVRRADREQSAAAAALEAALWRSLGEARGVRRGGGEGRAG